MTPVFFNVTERIPTEVRVREVGGVDRHVGMGGQPSHRHSHENKECLFHNISVIEVNNMPIHSSLLSYVAKI